MPAPAWNLPLSCWGRAVAAAGRGGPADWSVHRWCSGAAVEPHDQSEDAIREADPPFVSDRPPRLPPNAEAEDFERDFRKSRSWTFPTCVSAVLIALSLLGS